jgi:hypothetical protein
LLYETKFVGKTFEVGKIIPNIKLNGHNYDLRTYIIDILSLNDKPLMIILVSSDIERVNLKEKMLFDDLKLSDFDYKIVQVSFEGIEEFDYIIIRPDLIIEDIEIKNN